MKNAVAYTAWYVFYDIKEKKQISNDKVHVSYKTRVVVGKDFSWLDKEALSKNRSKLGRILEHESGHLQVAYILANQSQKKDGYDLSYLIIILMK